MSKPMTAAEARKIADSFPGDWNHYEHTRIRVGLRAYADMLDRQTVDREAAERERLAKLAEDGDTVIMWRSLPSVAPDPTGKSPITVADWIRAQLETRRTDIEP